MANVDIHQLLQDVVFLHIKNGRLRIHGELVRRIFGLRVLFECQGIVIDPRCECQILVTGRRTLKRSGREARLVAVSTNSLVPWRRNLVGNAASIVSTE